MLTVTQAATLLGVTPITVRTWIHRGHIHRQPVTGLITNAELMHWWDTTRRHNKAHTRRPTVVQH